MLINVNIFGEISRTF